MATSVADVGDVNGNHSASVTAVSVAVTGGKEDMTRRLIRCRGLVVALPRLHARRVLLQRVIRVAQDPRDATTGSSDDGRGRPAVLAAASRTEMAAAAAHSVQSPQFGLASPVAVAAASGAPIGARVLCEWIDGTAGFAEDFVAIAQAERLRDSLHFPASSTFHAPRVPRSKCSDAVDGQSAVEARASTVWDPQRRLAAVCVQQAARLRALALRRSRRESDASDASDEGSQSPPEENPSTGCVGTTAGAKSNRRATRHVRRRRREGDGWSSVAAIVSAHGGDAKMGWPRSLWPRYEAPREANETHTGRSSAEAANVAGASGFLPAAERPRFRLLYARAAEAAECCPPCSVLRGSCAADAAATPSVVAANAAARWFVADDAVPHASRFFTFAEVLDTLSKAVPPLAVPSAVSLSAGVLFGSGPAAAAGTRRKRNAASVTEWAAPAAAAARAASRTLRRLADRLDAETRAALRRSIVRGARAVAVHRVAAAVMYAALFPETRRDQFVWRHAFRLAESYRLCLDPMLLFVPAVAAGLWDGNDDADADSDGGPRRRGRGVGEDGTSRNNAAAHNERGRKGDAASTRKCLPHCDDEPAEANGGLRRITRVEGPGPPTSELALLGGPAFLTFLVDGGVAVGASNGVGGVGVLAAPSATAEAASRCIAGFLERNGRAPRMPELQALCETKWGRPT